MSRRNRVPWVRTRIAHLPGIASAVVLLTLVTGFLAAALPLQLDRYQDRALAAELAGAGLTGQSVRIGGNAVNTLQSEQTWEFATPGALAEAQDALRGALGAPLTLDREAETAGLHTLVVGDPLPLSGLALSGPGVAAGPQSPRIDLVWQPDPHHEVRLVQGRMPADTAPTRGPDAPDGTPGAPSGPFEIAVSDSTATRFGLRLGGLYQLGPAAQARLVGVYHVDRPQDPYWNTGDRLDAPTTLSVTPPHTADTIDYPYADALTSRGGALVMRWLGPTEAYWWYPLRAGSLKAYQIGAARQELASVTNGGTATWIYQQWHAGLSATTRLDPLLASYDAERGALAPLTTVGVAGTAGVGAVVLLMLLGLAAERRREELRLLRARGASLPGLWARLFAESALYAGVGTALGAGAALLLLPSGRHRAALAAAALVWLAAALAHPVRLLAGHRRVQPRGRAEDVLSARPSRRRTVAELTVLAATLAAALVLRGRGTDPAGGVDPMVTLAPLLLGLSGAILLVRLYPLPVRLLSLPSRRRDGAIAFLGLARAGRGSASAALLPLLAMLLALTVGAFGGSVLSGVQQARETGALSLVGADARVSTDSTDLDPSLVRAVGRLPGVRSVEPVLVQRDLALGETARFDILGVRPDSYAALARRVGRGGFDAAQLRWDGHGPLPALASPAVAAFFGGAVQSIDSDYGPLQVRVVATISATPAQGTNDFVVLPAAPLLAAEQAHNGFVNGPRVLLLSGSVDGRALRAVVARAPGASAVDTAVLTEQRARLAGSPLQAGATGIYLASVVATGLLCLLAVLLSLLEASPERSRLLARLRTMGLTTRQGYALILTESLPPVLLAAVAGTLLGLLTVPVLGSAVDLGALSGTASLSGVGISRGLRVEALPLLGPGVLLLVLAAVVVAAEAALIGRRQIGAQLRVGDAT
ncbi:ABC transporter permease [Streptacidiphilus pinicola]|uniref:ABC transporter permease n=1 Tax=Streptacidiphilus pinicola TaxID=2219663 RepID=A0A2X0IJH0_9ACTN|nr:FtsX-like permease family protein [Streptacidiphilus pinicola]RAG85182.1 ABC transporter permease [Streptacidiphilus pinicola]